MKNNHRASPAGESREDEKEKGLDDIARALCGRENGFARVVRRSRHEQPLPSLGLVIEVVEALRSVLFPGYFGFPDLKLDSVLFHVGATLDRVQFTLREQIRRGLCFACLDDNPCVPECDEPSAEITGAFFGRLPHIQSLLVTDVQAAFEGDPAASSPDEIIFSYPGLMAITSYRMAHELHRLGVPLIPRMITEHAHGMTGIDIHPGAVIGESFFIDHGTGVVIGETSIIGDRARLYQGVTLGAKSFKLDEEGNPVKGIPRHPVVEDDVTIYSGATILGRVTIGRGSVIGGNVWLVHDVPPGSRITQAHVRDEDFDKGGGI